MNIIKEITDFLWGWPLIILIFSVSLIFSFELKFLQFRKIGFIMKNTFGKMFEKNHSGEGTVTPFQAVSTALAATVGVGNIAGVGVAIAAGGPGAIFWMWIVAFIAMIAKYAEITLAVRYREKNPENGEYHGGPMYYIKNGLGKNFMWLSILWSIIFTFMMFIGGFVQANSMAEVLYESFSVNRTMVGVILAIFTGIVIVGGIKTIGKFAEKIIPFMAIIYIIASLTIIFLNGSRVGAAFSSIFHDAFTGSAAVGGFAGSTILLAVRNGFARGVYSNESGMGTAPVAHSSATTSYAAKQGLWGLFEVFVDTILICTMTALVILTSGVIETGKGGAALTATAFRNTLGGKGDLVVTICIILFAFTTALVDGYYSETGLTYAIKTTKLSIPFRILYCLGMIVGAVGGLQVIWGLFDFFMAFEVIINLIVLLKLRKDVVEETDKYFNSKEVMGENYKGYSI
ncbi:AGCS family alanine or glycine:cation symporter [Clostridium tetanomorphum]|uniref:Sodium:alanine symporter family protein n=1 Tax=Clostridium tetanomorphum TaxID=1553 RepID=A0A923E7P5_CLOTT|nr:sodium:alanine symporter family protein [Clostridium tetanomorphum]KAJ50302.1 Na+-linked D-alanine/glycine permease [Clostridium tetanomorphum DSM 665]MBC2397963.1 sodium:alanine symporter family protein [Clostridium tetanomorphum]MBP1864531.1 AGCS family alanine or glycine:cation symporter [Clostridium tetanomorphum]NRS82937.1 AGCS family alanine or glycine:cation symporter [Clostridium tetanomorphum]NRZ98966.1 AGCS family alanine or glycine:cation symporter [Clostridium tetanomorphum]